MQAMAISTSISCVQSNFELNDLAFVRKDRLSKVRRACGCELSGRPTLFLLLSSFLLLSFCFVFVFFCYFAMIGGMFELS